MTAPSSWVAAPAVGDRSVGTGRTRSGSAPSASNTARACSNRLTAPEFAACSSGAASAAGGDLQQRADQIADVGGRPGLVGHHIHRPVAIHAPRDGSDEVAAIAGVEPRRCALHARPATRRALPARRPVCCGRTRSAAPDESSMSYGSRRSVETAAEHVVGGQMDEPGARAGAGPRNISGADRVHRVGALRIGLRRVHGGVGRAVDHHIA